jgi:hypothetical protein
LAKERFDALENLDHDPAELGIVRRRLERGVHQQ